MDRHLKSVLPELIGLFFLSYSMRMIALLLFFSLSSCWALRAYKIRKMKMNDFEKLPSVAIDKPALSFHFIEGDTDNDLNLYLDSNLANTQTGAFLVIRNDTILYERYFNGVTRESLLPSNSMAKSFTGSLVAIALAEGVIRSTAEPITNYLPELLKHDTGFDKITIQHLLDMRSGLLFNEGRYDIHDDAIRSGLSHNIRKRILKVRIAESPGKFRYQSINCQLLGMILERTTHRKLYTYLEEKLWKPLGAEHNASWNVDNRKKKFVYTSAGLNATARDFAKLGQLYLNEGNWEGKQLIPAPWVRTITNMDTMEKYGGYKNQWWSRLTYHSFSDSMDAVSFKEKTPYAVSIKRTQDDYKVNYRTGSISAIGFLNQCIYVNPKKKVIIVRLGRRWKHPDMNAVQFVQQLAEWL